MTATPIPRRPTMRIAIAAIVLPLIWAILAAVVVALWRSDLPDPIATHWGARSMPDGFGSADQPLWMLLVVALIVIVAGIAITVTAPSSPIARSFVGLTSGLSAFLAVLIVGLTVVQRGVADAAQVAFPGWVVPVAGVIGVGAGFLAAAVIPPWMGTLASPASESAEALPIGPNERVVWSSAVTSPLPIVLIAGLAVVATAVGAVLLGMWWMLTITAVLLVAMATMLTVRVTVDCNGLRVRGVLGWPRTRIAAADIATVGTTRVRALRDFGGFGYRMAVTGPLRGARGIVLRSGEALVVTTREGRTEVVVVDDAQSGAAVLEAVRLRETNRTR